MADRGKKRKLVIVRKDKYMPKHEVEDKQSVPVYTEPSDDLFLPLQLPFKSSGPKFRGQDIKGPRWKRVRQLVQIEQFHLAPASEATYTSIEAPVSMYPPKKYCDITGLPAMYTEPNSKLRYASTHTYSLIRSLPAEQIQATLALRNAAVVLK
mmetsp:Transcript_4142/g.7972  ORF Transcript_4142/g.7972 Transcript_4142/m.7972 type:complete len:153 (+) Transcript_4142:144-602(+)|eukprot:CAMPEP_0114256446 /NCGR_PEP_ID=MMETSP0058-20121206/18155_1 /TAXON_ID=36894 /ORGANISM="Pyramimonas parkeae, CCMP726" /LENGTH=152 /DNA_ID=CAMNT_0001371009 /DNA_START=144 /DNA_END=602 /DNA_ORIENTATION=+